MDKIPKKENIILAGDFIGRIGNQPHREQVANQYGATLRDFCAFNELKITNSFYRQKDKQIYLGGKRDQVNNRLRKYEW